MFVCIGFCYVGFYESVVDGFVVNGYFVDNICYWWDLLVRMKYIILMKMDMLGVIKNGDFFVVVVG